MHFAALIADRADDAGFAAFRAAEQSGRPVGTTDFVAGLERILGRPIARRASERKPMSHESDQPELL